MRRGKVSERDDVEPRRQVSYAPLWLVVFYTCMLAVLVLALALATHSELRDLQRRVGQLEEQVK
jgi:hypothetical protein